MRAISPDPIRSVRSSRNHTYAAALAPLLDQGSVLVARHQQARRCRNRIPISHFPPASRAPTAGTTPRPPAASTGGQVPPHLFDHCLPSTSAIAKLAAVDNRLPPTDDSVRPMTDRPLSCARSDPPQSSTTSPSRQTYPQPKTQHPMCHTRAALSAGVSFLHLWPRHRPLRRCPARRG